MDHKEPEAVTIYRRWRGPQSDYQGELLTRWEYKQEHDMSDDVIDGYVRCSYLLHMPSHTFVTVCRCAYRHNPPHADSQREREGVKQNAIFYNMLT